MQSVALDPHGKPILIGRNPEASVMLANDRAVSRGHATVAFVQGVWVIDDIGSKGGTFLLREGRQRRIAGTERLLHGDRVRVGATTLTFEDPPIAGEVATQLTDQHLASPTPRELEVLTFLCRLELEGLGGTPGDAEIAGALFITTNTVKRHLQNLYLKFQIEGPARQKRARLVRRAIADGWVRVG
jgi:pSer/pThr/pTyr-binding forkhead associated (FHA) protein